MSNPGVAKEKYLPHLLSLILIIAPCLPVRVLAAAQGADTADTEISQGLDAEGLKSLQSLLAELRALAPKLRVLVRTLRQQVGFDPHEVQIIERGVSQSQKDIERLIAMHQRQAFNKMRAHFLADDLRRKSEALKDSLGYIKRRIRELDKAPGDRLANAELKKSDDELVTKLGLYSNLVAGGVILLQEKRL